MRLTILGCYAATPRTFTNPTSQVLNIQNHLMLIDCGEGTQVQLRKYKVKFSRIKHIFISHLHGDHFFGLPGLISSFRLLGREEELHIYGPKGIKEAISLLLKLGDSWTNYPLIFHELDARESIPLFADEKVEVHTIPLDHRIYTNGFLFREKEAARTLDVAAAAKWGIETAQYAAIKAGADGRSDRGETVPNERLTLPPPRPNSYAFCSDTLYNEAMVPLIAGTRTLYHESTFLETELHLCKRTKHSTARQAGEIARLAGVGRLILGHYSTRYRSLDLFRAEARAEFPQVELAEDGKVFEL